MARSSDIAKRRASARKTDDPNYHVRRAEIINVAAAVFRRKGMGSTSLDDIAKELGKDRASLYYYTSGKDELFQEVVADAVYNNIVEVERLEKSPGRADERLRSLVKTLLNSYSKHYPYLFVYIQEPMAHLEADTPWNKKMQSLNKRFDTAVQNIVKAGLDDGIFKSGSAHTNAKLIAYAVIGMCNWTHRWFQPDGPFSAAEIGDVFVDIILNGIQKSAR